MNQEIQIVTIRNSALHKCWVKVEGDKETPIRRGLYGENVPAVTVMRELINTAIVEQGGPVKVRVLA